MVWDRLVADEELSITRKWRSFKKNNKSAILKKIIQVAFAIPCSNTYGQFSK